MRVLTASGHSKVEVGCHQRRVSENWHPPTPPEPVEIGTILVESNLASHLESHQSARTAGSRPLLGVYPMIIIKKKEKLFMKVSWEYYFQMVKNWNCIDQRLVNFFYKGLDGNFLCVCVCEPCSVCLSYSTLPWTKL